MPCVKDVHSQNNRHTTCCVHVNGPDANLLAKALQQVGYYQEIYELVVLSGWIIGGEGG
jgi:hypothetical protein